MKIKLDKMKNKMAEASHHFNISVSFSLVHIIFMMINYKNGDIKRSFKIKSLIFLI